MNNDPTESFDVAHRNPEIVQDLEAILLEHIDKHKPDSPREILTPDEPITSELQVLGYAEK